MEMGSGRPTDPAFCLILKAQLSQALEELGGQKQRADMVSPSVVVFVATGSSGWGCLRPWV